MSPEDFIVVPVKVRRGNLEAYTKGVGCRCVHLVPESDETYTLVAGDSRLPVSKPYGYVPAKHCGYYRRGK